LIPLFACGQRGDLTTLPSMRCLALGLLVLSGWAAEPAADALPMPDFALEAGSGATLNFKADTPNVFRGGVRLAWSGLLLHCDNLSFVRTPFAGSREPILAEANLGSGPQGPSEQERPIVVLDSTKATLPTIAFKGRLTPGSLHLTRLALDPKRPDEVRFSVTFAPLGDFSGQIRDEQGWKTIAGWAERGEAELIAKVGPKGLVDPRFVSILLMGTSPSAEGERRRAWMVGPQPAQGGSNLMPPGWIRVDAADFRIRFDDQGGFAALDTALDSAIQSVPEPVAPTQP
jgi:hypothetical protein